MRLCSYVVVHDYGFAPNPFHGYCTLAVCTPNHRGIKLAPGDWLVGHSTVAEGQRLIYAMRVSEVLDFDRYYCDPRFTAKKPRLDRTWREACGDNIYYLDENGSWKQAPTPFHNSPEDVKKDAKNPRVFISDHFYYFGENAPAIPIEFTDLIWGRRGYRCEYPAEVTEKFVEWLQTTYSPGVHGEPRDRQEGLGAEASRDTRRCESKAEARPKQERRVRTCGEQDPILGFGSAPVDSGIPDGSQAHDRYLYGAE